MTIRIATALQNSMAAEVTAGVDGGAGAGTVEIRSGAQPASANDADAGTLLATFTLNDPSFGSPASGVITLVTSPAITTTGSAAGTAGHARVKDSTGATQFDGSVGASGSGEDFEMSTTTVSVGLDLELTAGTMTMPSGE